MEYDALGRLDLITYADNTTEDLIYDTADNLIAKIDRAGQRTDFLYDALGRVTKEILPDPDGAGAQLRPESTSTTRSGR